MPSLSASAYSRPAVETSILLGFMTDKIHNDNSMPDKVRFEDYSSFESFLTLA
jgi:hypothetical protein